MKAFKLDNGKFLALDHGKYRSGLAFVADKEFFNDPFSLIKNKEVFDGIKLTVKVGKWLTYTRYIINGIEGFFYVKNSVCNYDEIYVHPSMEHVIKDFKKDRGNDIALEIVHQESIPIYKIDYEYIVKDIPIELPYDGNYLGGVEGAFRTNKKGTKIFDLTKKGDVLYIVNWGGAFSSSRGFFPYIDNIIKDYKYYRHARSNGGKLGKDYLIVSKDSELVVNEDDI